MTEQVRIRMNPTQRMVERLVWREAFLWVWEQILCLSLLLLPRLFIVRALRLFLAKRVFACDPASVTLYKSGRSALHGALATIRRSDPRRSVVFIPDYTCNVVSVACLAAGFEVQTYQTTDCCEPLWAELAEAVQTVDLPVVVFCSLFGTVPIADEHVSGLLALNAGLIVVADECQNLVPDSCVTQTPAHVIVFSFNDKTCPGIMGGGVVWNRGTFGEPFFDEVPESRRWKCRMGLLGLFVRNTATDAKRLFRLCFRLNHGYARPTNYEFSHCHKPHYDVRAEPIYKVSAARATLSVRALARYRRRRGANVLAIQGYLGDSAFVNARAAASHFPPILPLEQAFVDANPGQLPFPMKAPYAMPADPEASLRRVFAIKLSSPFVRYVDRAHAQVGHISSPKQERS